MGSLPSKTAAAEAGPITAKNLKRRFPDTFGYLAVSQETSNPENEKALEGADPEQVKKMREMCIVIDQDDKPIGSGEKKICHARSNIEKGLLHRAFSVFLFDSQNRLLLQKRALTKVTFPDMWTNTCCSHPLNFKEEAGVTLEEAKLGAKRAAIRKLYDELRIKVPPEHQNAFLNKVHFLARIQYQAVNVSPDDKDNFWGEYEIDYILFIKTDIDHTANPEEASDTRYVTPEELKEMRKDSTLKFTPWFTLLCDKVLFQWWDQLDTIANGNFESEKDIRRW